MSNKPPTPQADRPIALFLVGVASIFFTTRPEELVWSEPSRTMVTQTLGGAWLDTFGPGLATITISGHTGWRHDRNDFDWLGFFERLNDLAFSQWHKKVELAGDPEKVELRLFDVLDNRAVVVAPMMFQLRRSKSRPLLMQYTISFSVLRYLDAPKWKTPEPTGLQKFVAAMKSLSQTLATINAYVSTAKLIASGNKGALVGVLGKVLGPDVGAAINGVMRVNSQATKLASSIMETNNSASSLPSAVRSAVLALSDSSTSMLQHLASGVPPGSGLGSLMELSSSCHNISCLFRNALKPAETYEQYDPLYGASTCSSTAGGRGISEVSGNALELVSPVEVPLITISSSAQSALAQLKASDPVLKPLPASTVAALARDISDGISVRSA